MDAPHVSSHNAPLTRGMQRLLGWIGFSSFMCVIVFSTTDRESVPSYEWALDLAPTYTYRAVWLLLTAGVIAILAGWINPSWRFFVLAGYSLVQAMFTIAILTVAIPEGREAAMVGAMQWGGYVYFSVMSLIDRPPRPSTQSVKDG